MQHDCAGLSHVVAAPPGIVTLKDLPPVNPAQTLSASWLALPHYAKGVCLMLALALGYALPVMGVSLLAFVLVDVLRWRRQQRAPMSEAEILAAQQSPLGIVRARFTVKRKEMRYYLRGLFILALIVGTVMSNAIIGGVIAAVLANALGM